MFLGVVKHAHIDRDHAVGLRGRGGLTRPEKTTSRDSDGCNHCGTVEGLKAILATTRTSWVLQTFYLGRLIDLAFRGATSLPVCKFSLQLSICDAWRGVVPLPEVLDYEDLVTLTSSLAKHWLYRRNPSLRDSHRSYADILPYGRILFLFLSVERYRVALSRPAFSRPGSHLSPAFKREVTRISSCSPVELIRSGSRMGVKTTAKSFDCSVKTAGLLRH